MIPTGAAYAVGIPSGAAAVWPGRCSTHHVGGPDITDTEADAQQARHIACGLLLWFVMYLELRHE